MGWFNHQLELFDVRFGAIAGAFLPLVLYTLVQPQSFGCGAVHRADVGDGWKKNTMEVVATMFKMVVTPW